MPAAQTETENCVAHNGSIIPVPGRDIMVQGWYQGGLSVFDFTDSTKPVEIAFFDRGPVDATKLVTAATGPPTGTTAMSTAPRSCAWHRHLPPAAERVPHAERDRRGDSGALHGVQRAAAAEDRVAGDHRRRPRVSRSADAFEQHPGGSRGGAQGGVRQGRRAAHGSRARCGRRPRRARRHGHRAREGCDVGHRPRSACACATLAATLKGRTARLRG